MISAIFKHDGKIEYCKQYKCYKPGKRVLKRKSIPHYWELYTKHYGQQECRICKIKMKGKEDHWHINLTRTVKDTLFMRGESWKIETESPLCSKVCARINDKIIRYRARETIKQEVEEEKKWLIKNAEQERLESLKRMLWETKLQLRRGAKKNPEALQLLKQEYERLVSLPL